MQIVETLASYNWKSKCFPKSQSCKIKKKVLLQAVYIPLSIDQELMSLSPKRVEQLPLDASSWVSSFHKSCLIITENVLNHF